MRPDLNSTVADGAAVARRPRGRLLGLGLGFAIALAALLAAPAAHASDRIYWSNYETNQIVWADLNGDGGGGTVDTTGATVDGPMGLAADPSRGLVYWVNWNADRGTTISYAHLDGSGAGDLAITGTTIHAPHGLAIDTTAGTAGRLYWLNHDAHAISWADLDGAGGGTGGELPITTATVDEPRGMMIDPLTDRIYWSNFAAATGMTISYLNLDGTGDGDLLDIGPLGEGPEGTAINPATRKIYWSDFGQKHLIQFADVDFDTGVSTLNTAGAGAHGVHGVAIDPDTQRIYWANWYSDGIGSANLDGSGGADLNVSGTPISRPNLPILLKQPGPVAAPQISGGSNPGATLSCSPGTWAGDVLESLAYRAPESLAYQWIRDGADLPGAAAKTSSITADSEGNYRCRVTATNAAGATSQTSSAHTVGNPVDAPPTAVADRATVAENAGPSAIDVLANDTDSDGGPLAIASVQAGPAAHGTVAIDPDHQGLTYEPGPDYCNSVPGYDPATFAYTLNGGSQATVTVDVHCSGSTPPTLTSTDPASPSSVGTPKVKGISPNRGTGSRIKLFVNDPTCSGSPAASSNVATFQGKGTAVGPLAIGASDIRATFTDPVGNVSACSAPISYTRLRGPAPTITATDPASPSTVSSPRVKGVSPAAGTGYRIKYYVNDATCSGPAAAESNVASFQGKGVRVGPLAVGTSQIRVTLTDPAGVVSVCSAAIGYTRLG
jgi:hypothetical protein